MPAPAAAPSPRRAQEGSARAAALPEARLELAREKLWKVESCLAAAQRVFAKLDAGWAMRRE